MPFIYKISNKINNKVYIGKTLYTIERRWLQHLTNAKTREDLSHLPLYAAIRKYGIKNFQISEVEQINDYNKLSEREIYWITYYNSYNNGYNATRGGDGSLLYDYDWIWELWESGLKIKDISKIVGCNDFVVRTVLDLHNISTQERKQRSQEDLDKSHKYFSRVVEQIDINTGEVLAEYESVSIAAKTIHCDSSYLSKCCRNNKIGLGYQWRYKDNVSYTPKDFSKKQVCKLDLKTGEVLEIFESVSAAARAVQGDSSYISKVCKGTQKSSKGFGWCYLQKD